LFRIAHKLGTSALLRQRQRGLESLADHGIGRNLRPSFECRVLFVELRFQDAHPVKLRKQQRRGFRDRAEGVVRALALVSGELLLCARKVEIVEQVKTLVERCAGGLRCNRRAQDHQQDRHRYQPRAPHHKHTPSESSVSSSWTKLHRLAPELVKKLDAPAEGTVTSLQ
jgi:hypothetical protein